MGVLHESDQNPASRRGPADWHIRHGDGADDRRQPWRSTHRSRGGRLRTHREQCRCRGISVSHDHLAKHNSAFSHGDDRSGRNQQFGKNGIVRHHVECEPERLHSKRLRAATGVGGDRLHRARFTAVDHGATDYIGRAVKLVVRVTALIGALIDPRRYDFQRVLGN